MEHGPISFPDWKLALARAGLEPAVRGAFEREIISFLRHCKARHAPVTAELAREYLPARELLGHAGVKTTRIYLHVMQKPGLGVKSPLDAG